MLYKQPTREFATADQIGETGGLSLFRRRRADHRHDTFGRWRLDGRSKPWPPANPSTSRSRVADRTAPFSWGVLDRLLEEDQLQVAAIAGTSAGAMNAVAFADGWVAGGAEGARAKLESFWRSVGRKGRFSPVQRTPWDVLTGNWSIENSPSFPLVRRDGPCGVALRGQPFQLQSAARTWCAAKSTSTG